VITVLGIDGGMSGALAVLREDGRLWVADTPTYEHPTGGRRLATTELLWAIDMAEADAAYLERGQEMMRVALDGTRRRQGHMYEYGFTNGQIQMACVVKLGDADVHIIEPQAWKRWCHLLGKDKEKSRELAIEWWPKYAGSYFSRKMDHNRAEAALIARYGLFLRIGN
jgi:crossover junction endodeoxyribonuclease RuvC